MKKTLTINLGGIVFHIDEDAYISLSQYLEALKKHFGEEDGWQDILGDIESRIAEILNDRRSETKEVITQADVDDVIAIMGQPVEIDQSENQFTGQEQGKRERGEKRFFRNPDEKVIAGVCSGIAAYFHLDPVWIRLLFILFIAAGGSGILLYIVLWIVIPEAQSTTDKLEMRGTKVNISNIQKSMRNEVSALGNKLGSMAHESAASIKRAGTGSASVFETLGKGLAEVLTFFGRGFVILAGAVLILAGAGMLLALLAYVLGWTGGFYADNDFTVLAFPAMAKLLVGCNMPVVYLQVILLMVLGIPFFMLFYNGLRMVFRFDRIRHLGLTMFNIWLVGMFFLAWSSLRVYNLYKYEEEKQIEIALENPSADTLFVKLFPDDPGLKYIHHEQFVLPGDWKTIITENRELYVLPKIRIEQADDSLFSISQVAIARGKTRLQAHQHLTGMRYQSATSGSTLKLSPFVRLQEEECWRGQLVDVIIRVPRGKFISFDPEFRDLKLYWYFMLNDSDARTFLMTENGIEVNPGIDYIKARGDTTSTITIRK